MRSPHLALSPHLYASEPCRHAGRRGADRAQCDPAAVPGADRSFSRAVQPSALSRRCRARRRQRDPGAGRDRTEHGLPHGRRAYRSGSTGRCPVPTRSSRGVSTALDHPSEELPAPPTQCCCTMPVATAPRLSRRCPSSSCRDPCPRLPVRPGVATHRPQPRSGDARRSLHDHGAAHRPRRVPDHELARAVPVSTAFLAAIWLGVSRLFSPRPELKPVESPPRERRRQGRVRRADGTSPYWCRPTTRRR